MKSEMDSLEEKPKTSPTNGRLQSEEESQEEKEDGYDFSQLPEPVWVRVFDYLPLSDQYRASLTCWELYAIFNHPSNWRSADLNVMGGAHNYRMSKMLIADRFKIIVEKFGRYFQRLNVKVGGHLMSMADDVRHLLASLAAVCRLRHLSLELGMLTSDFHLYGYRPVQTDIQAIIALVTNATRLKTLEVVSWPMYPEIFENASTNVFEAIKTNAKLTGSLESLSLFWMKGRQWSERCPLLPSFDYTQGLVNSLPCLTHLALRSPMLSNELLNTLAQPKRAPLKSLQILLQYGTTASVRCLPDLQAESWKALRGASPGLKVEMAVFSRLDDGLVERFLSAEIPLAAFTIHQYARCSPSLMFLLASRYPTSLRSFHCYADPSDCDTVLQKLPDLCSSLEELVFHGAVGFRTVEFLSDGVAWKTLVFVEKQIYTAHDDWDEADEDAVLARGEDEELVQLDLVRFHGTQSEEEREQILSELYAHVSERIGHSWQAL